MGYTRLIFSLVRIKYVLETEGKKEKRKKREKKKREKEGDPKKINKPDI